MSSGNGTTPPGTAEKSLGEIVSEVSEKASLLVREEIELAKAEVTEKVMRIAKGAAIGAAAGVFLLFALVYFMHLAALIIDDALNVAVVGPTVEALVLFKWTGVDLTSPLIAYYDDVVNLPLTPTGQNETTIWPINPPPRKVFKI